jgi:hypothetical protein
MSLAALRSASKNLNEKFQQSQQSYSRTVDERIWKPTFDREKGTGTATIRFLPSCPSEIENYLPQVKLFKYNFTHAGKWYIEKSPRTINKPDPVFELNGRLYNSGVESDKEISKKLKRDIVYYSNVLVLKDPANKENEGKVFIYEYGPAIANKIHEAQFPSAEFEGEDPPEPLNPFDIDSGADFIIRMIGKEIVGKDGKKVVVPNYEKSTFKETRSPLCDGKDDKIEEVWNKCYPLQPFIGEDVFESYDTLSAKLVKVFGHVIGSGVPVLTGKSVEQSFSNDTQVQNSRQPPTTPSLPASSDDGDSDLDFLNSLDD